MSGRVTTPAARGGECKRWRVARWSGLVFGAALAMGSASASGLQATPVLLEFTPNQRAQAVWLSNTSKQPLKAQVRVLGWRQADGEETLERTTELVASPPLVEIPPGQTQIVRIVRTPASRPQAESAYRLLVDQLPESAARTTPQEASRPGGVQFLFRYVIPVFVAPTGGTDTALASAPGPAPASLVSARLALAGDQKALLTIRNNGPRRVKFSGMTYVDAASGERQVFAAGLFGYVLSGAARQWTVPVPASLQRIDGTLQARINEDDHETVLAQDPGQP
ncbi:fimbrial biogenesis chaperone [Hydrogenophaga sp.]|uniref:fimbrial biogenesis chaperone n=1 Tax=Hydrogenophaga sp. TaxID=1904254 RepID=UPI003F70624C